LDDHAQSLSGVLLYLKGAKTARRRAEELAELTLTFSGGAIKETASEQYSTWLDDESKGKKEKRKLRVLCLDGGGMRGLNLLIIIKELEKRTGVPASQLFDVVAGTSIGGCGALFLHHFADDATEQAQAALEGLRTRCFANTSPGRLMLRGRRCHDDRAGLLRDLTGSDEVPLLSSHINEKPYAFVVACRKRPQTGEPEPYLFRTYETQNKNQPLPGTCEATLIEAIAATTAAPTYFPPHEHRGEHLLADGGCCFNNPSMIALHEIAANFPDYEIDTLVSIGCGFVPSRYAQEQEEFLTHTFAKETLAANNPMALYERLDPPMPKRVSPGEYRSSVLDNMLTHTKQWLNEPQNSERLDNLAARLLAGVTASSLTLSTKEKAHTLQLRMSLSSSKGSSSQSQPTANTNTMQQQPIPT